MAVKARVVDDWLVVLTVTGELDAYLAPDLRDSVEEMLKRGGVPFLLVDMMEVDYLDSVGLGILVGAAQRASERGGDLALACTRANVLRVLEVSGTRDLLNVRPSTAEARAKLEAARAGSAGAKGGSGAAGTPRAEGAQGGEE